MIGAAVVGRYASGPGRRASGVKQARASAGRLAWRRDASEPCALSDSLPRAYRPDGGGTVGQADHLRAADWRLCVSQRSPRLCGSLDRSRPAAYKVGRLV